MTSNAPPLYPNRKLGFATARTPEDDAYAPNALANVALANLRPGERLPIRGVLVPVSAITHSALTVVMPDGRKRRLSPTSPAWESVMRDAYGIILGHAHSHGWSEEPDLIKALRRDPACARDERGILHLRDSAPLPTPSPVPATGHAGALGAQLLLAAGLAAPPKPANTEVACVTGDIQH